MKKLTPMLLGIVVLLGLVPQIAIAQDPPPASPFSLSVFYSFKSKESALIIAKPFDELYRKDKLTIELIGFVGAGVDSGVIGGNLGFRYQLHDRISFWFGPGFAKSASSLEDMFSSLKGFEMGFAGGITYQMRF